MPDNPLRIISFFIMSGERSVNMSLDDNCPLEPPDSSEGGVQKILNFIVFIIRSIISFLFKFLKIT